MGFKFLTVSPCDLAAEASDTSTFPPGPSEVTAEGGANFPGAAPGAACLLIGWRGPRPPNHTSVSTTPQRAAAAAHAHSGTSACASASRELRAPANGWREPRLGVPVSTSPGSPGTRSGPVGERQENRALTQLSDFPTSLKCKFSWVDHSLSLWNPRPGQSDFPEGTGKRSTAFFLCAQAGRKAG